MLKEAGEGDTPIVCFHLFKILEKMNANSMVARKEHEGCCRRGGERD